MTQYYVAWYLLNNTTCSPLAVQLPNEKKGQITHYKWLIHLKITYILLAISIKTQLSDKICVNTLR